MIKAKEKNRYKIYNKKGLYLYGTIRKDGTIYINGLSGFEVKKYLSDE